MDSQDIHHVAAAVLMALSIVATEPSSKVAESNLCKRKRVAKVSFSKRANTNVEPTVSDVIPKQGGTGAEGGAWNNTTYPIGTLNFLVRSDYLPLVKEKCG